MRIAQYLTTPSPALLKVLGDLCTEFSAAAFLSAAVSFSHFSTLCFGILNGTILAALAVSVEIQLRS